MLPVGEFKTGWILSLKSYPFKQGKTFYKWRRAKITLNKNNPVHVYCSYMQNLDRPTNNRDEFFQPNDLFPVL